MELKYEATREGRLSSFLKKEMGMSTGLINRLKWQQKLFVNGVSRHTNYMVKAGDVITVAADEPVPEYPAEDGELTILFEDEHFLAVDKPAGMLIHPSRNRITGTLANRVVGYYQRTGQHSAFHPITRLDRDTFGVVLLAKNAHIHALMQHTPMEKTYHALTFGGPEEDGGIIDLPIARKPLPSLLREVRPDGKPSTTEFTVLERQGSTCLLALRPVTGRTHQLRVHCAYMGYPIVGDPQYGSESSMAFSNEQGCGTQLLCAKTLAFTHPVTGAYLCLDSKMEVTCRSYNQRKLTFPGKTLDFQEEYHA